MASLPLWLVHPPSFALLPSPFIHLLPHPIRRSLLPRFFHLHSCIRNRYNEYHPSWRFPRPVLLCSRHKERLLVANGRLRHFRCHLRWFTLHWLVLQISHSL